MNSVVSVASLSSAAAVSSPSIAADSVDPIFAAIEEHRSAFQAYLDFTSNVPDDEDLVCAGPAYDTLYGRTEEASVVLTNVQPTTIGGVIALLAHIHEFNLGAITAKERPHRHYSEHTLLPDDLIDGETMSRRGRDLELPFPYWVMQNVRSALVEMCAS